MIAYVILGYCYDINKPLPEHARPDYTVEKLIERFGRFVKSCGVYGQTPYLYVDNGIGDIPQAFSRIASIFGSIFILHPKVEVDQIVQNQQGYVVKTNLCPDSQLTAKTLMMGPTYAQFCHSKMKQQLLSQTQYVIRITLICKKTPECIKISCPTLCHLYDLPNIENPVTMLLLDYTSSSCPEEEIIVTLETIVSKEAIHWQKIIELLTQTTLTLLNPSNEPNFILYRASFCQTNEYYPKNPLILQGGCWAVDLDGYFNEFKERAGQLPTYFKNEDNPHTTGDEEQPDYYQNLLSKLETVKKNAVSKQETTDPQPITEESTKEQPPLQQQPTNKTIEQNPKITESPSIEAQKVPIEIQNNTNGSSESVPEPPSNHSEINVPQS